VNGGPGFTHQQSDMEQPSEEKEEGGAGEEGDAPSLPPLLQAHSLSKEFYRVPPVFSHDGEALIITAQRDIIVLSTTTSEVIHRLNDDHPELVVGTSIGKNPSHLYSASSDGEYHTDIII